LARRLLNKAGCGLRALQAGMRGSIFGKNVQALQSLYDGKGGIAGLSLVPFFKIAYTKVVWQIPVMKILEIKDIIRKDVPIYYRRLYSGVAVLELVNKLREVSLEFQIEHKPTGAIEISVTLGEQVDYPLVPLQKELKNYIGSLDSTGKLPG
jgi:hypothetical protein